MAELNVRNAYTLNRREIVQRIRNSYNLNRGAIQRAKNIEQVSYILYVKNDLSVETQIPMMSFSTSLSTESYSVSAYVTNYLAYLDLLDETVSFRITLKTTFTDKSIEETDIVEADIRPPLILQRGPRASTAEVLGELDVYENTNPKSVFVEGVFSVSNNAASETLIRLAPVDILVGDFVIYEGKNYEVIRINHYLTPISVIFELTMVAL